MKIYFSSNSMTRKHIFSFFVMLSLMASATLFAPTRATAQDATVLPFRKDTLLKLVQSKQYKTDNIIKAVETKGVDFNLTDSVAAEFRAAGAFPELLEAIRSNYRPATVANNNGRNNGRNNNPTITSSNDPPLSEREIVTLLQNGVPSTRVQQVVSQRGVDFSMTPQIARSVTQAGGSNTLIATIRSSRRTANNTNSPVVRRNNAPNYDDLIERARDNNANVTQKAQFLQAAINLNAVRPEAYQLMGILELYGNKNFAEAERYMRAAVERGGDAVFKVYHDHDGFFNSYCQGSLYVSKSNLKYEADNYNSDGSIDSYAATFSDIKEAQINRTVGRPYGAFHIKVPGSKRGNYNFAPATKNSAESRLIISLLASK
ncbi:MAG: hypothetical protein NVSMB56_02860 [Pyrinomonadaceae bacterium]